MKQTNYWNILFIFEKRRVIKTDSVFTYSMEILFFQENNLFH